MVQQGIILGLGNPLLDISSNVDKEFLDKYELNDNNAILAEDKHIPLYAELCERYQVEYIPGGATQNSIRVAQWLLDTPQACSYIGCVGKDKYADIMRTKAENDRVHVAYMTDESTATGTCAVLITGDKRSLVANLSAANKYQVAHLREPVNWALVEAAQIYYISGFFLTVSPETIQLVARHAAEKNKIFAMNLAAPFLAQFFQEPMLEAAPYWDIVFGNETEAVAFAEQNSYGTTDIKEIAMKLSQHPKVNQQRTRMVVFTQGKDPTIVCQDGKISVFPVAPLAPEAIVDTNAAGDAFVGGFLAQLAQGKRLEECMACGQETAKIIIQRSGCSLPARQ